MLMITKWSRDPVCTRPIGDTSIPSSNTSRDHTLDNRKQYNSALSKATHCGTKLEASQIACTLIRFYVSNGNQYGNRELIDNKGGGWTGPADMWCSHVRGMPWIRWTVHTRNKQHGRYTNRAPFVHLTNMFFLAFVLPWMLLCGIQ